MSCRTLTPSSGRSSPQALQVACAPVSRGRFQLSLRTVPHPPRVVPGSPLNAGAPQKLKSCSESPGTHWHPALMLTRQEVLLSTSGPESPVYWRTVSSTPPCTILPPLFPILQRVMAMQCSSIPEAARILLGRGPVQDLLHSLLWSRPFGNLKTLLSSKMHIHTEFLIIFRILGLQIKNP